MKRVAIFCDVQSLWFNSKFWGEARVDYAKLMPAILDGRELVHCCAYLVEREGITQFERALNHMGYDTRVTARGNVEPMVSLGMRAIAEQADVIALASAGGRYLDVVRDLRAQGKRIELWSFPSSGPSTGVLADEVDAHRILDQSVLKETARAG